MNWLLALGLVLAAVLGLGAWWISRQFRIGLKAAGQAAMDVLSATDARVFAELFAGPLVEGARPLSATQAAQAREDLSTRVRHTLFRTQKEATAALGEYWTGLTEGQRTLWTNEAAEKLSALLGRAYYSGFVLGQMFARQGWWGPGQAELALGPEHAKEAYLARVQKLSQFHPWMEPLVREQFVQEVQLPAIQGLCAVYLQDADAEMKTTQEKSLLSIFQQAAAEAVLKGLFHGIEVQETETKTDKKSIPSGANGHPR